jgi:hypothetical protein
MMDIAAQRKNKKKEEVQDIESDEKDNASEETMPDSPAKGRGDELNQAEGVEEGDKEEKGKVTLPKDPLTEVDMPKKRKVSPQKPSTQKKSRANMPQSQNLLTMDNIDLIITVVEDASKTSCRDMDQSRIQCTTK